MRAAGAQKNDAIMLLDATQKQSRSITFAFVGNHDNQNALRTTTPTVQQFATSEFRMLWRCGDHRRIEQAQKIVQQPWEPRAQALRHPSLRCPFHHGRALGRRISRALRRIRFSYRPNGPLASHDKRWLSPPAFFRGFSHAHLSWMPCFECFDLFVCGHACMLACIRA